jgi:hypothetical protein
MNIKSLLLGSAAALAVVSGAHAADAVVAAEPEPLEYVRICDAYGAGYFYIPGTETCLKIGGKLRTEGKWYDAYNPSSRNGTLWHSRAELNLDTATDTEYGALKTEALIRWDWQEGGNGPDGNKSTLINAYISLGGFLVGKADSQYNQFTGYAGDIISDDVVYDGPYDTNQLTYNYDAGNGFTAVVSVEDSNSTLGNPASADHYAPDAVLGVGYKAGAWAFKVVGGYDSIVEEGAVKARVDADFGGFTAFLMGGWNTDGNQLNKYASAGGSGPAGNIGWGDWAVWGGVGVPFNDKLKWNLQLAYTDSKVFAAATNLKWNPVKNLLVEPEVTYTSWDSINADQWAGTLRFERNF